MTVGIEKAKEKDVALIIEMMREFAEFEELPFETSKEKLHKSMFGENSFVEALIAFADEIPVGYALFFPYFASFRGMRGFYLEDLYVKLDFRRHKIGEKFLRELAKIAKSRNFERIDFVVLDWNENAINFYKKLGAEVDETCRPFKFVGEAFENLAN